MAQKPRLLEESTPASRIAPPPPMALSPKKTAEKQRNKHGIPLLKDAAEFFSEYEEPVPIKSQAKPLTPLKKRTPSSSQRQEPVAAEKKTKGSLSRKGLPILQKDTDLFLAMQAERPPAPETPQKLPSHSMKKRPFPTVKTQSVFKDKNGIPILKDQTDFTRVFNAREIDPILSPLASRISKGKGQPPVEGERRSGEFALILRESLAAKSQDVLLKEKKGNRRPVPPISLEARLRRYPPPQKTLDLHGFSGIQARLKTEIFLQNTQSEGFFTVRIIVGRGLHSQGPAVLPDIVDQKIREMEETGTVLAWKWKDEKRERPEGSVRVFLKHFT